jgi:hypothetical protein
MKSMQEGDLSFPDMVQLTFYLVHAELKNKSQIVLPISTLMVLAH